MVKQDASGNPKAQARIIDTETHATAACGDPANWLKKAVTNLVEEVKGWLSSLQCEVWRSCNSCTSWAASHAVSPPTAVGEGLTSVVRVPSPDGEQATGTLAGTVTTAGGGVSLWCGRC